MSISDTEAAPAPGVPVDVWSQDPGAEVFLLDGRLQVAARGVGGLHATCRPGVYKLKIQAGQSIAEELLVLQEGQPYKKTFDPVPFASAAPLAATSRAHKYQMEGAVEESGKTHVSIGQGSKVFVFARDWTPRKAPSDSEHNPAEGLVLRSAEGDVLVDFEKQSFRNTREDPYAACGVALDPGSYRLGVTLSSGEVFEQTVVAAPGWRTDVFLLQREGEDPGAGKRPDLAGASISMSRRDRFNPDDPENRLTEVARMAVVNQRPILSGDLGPILHGKFEDPMLGILGGHLILMRPEPDPALLHEVVGNLRGLLRQPHPDVEALAMAAGLEPQSDFNMPPMLRRSWQLVVEASATRKGLAPAGTLSSRIATWITHQDPWLIWQKPPQEAGAGRLDFAEVVVRMLKPDAVQDGETPSLTEKGVRLYLTAAELALKYLPFLSPFLSSTVQTGIDQAFRFAMSDARMEQMVKTLGVPRANIEEMLTAAHKRFGGS
jgi:hypothetical protein